ncbi:hypothetical protein J6S88_07735 [bacterium]|nr:hypothetical protein [bacterium]
MDIPKQKKTPKMPITPIYIPKGPLMITVQGDIVENIKNVDIKIEFKEEDKK